MKKVIVIGAGPAGLTAGYELKKRAGRRFDVTILEKSGAVGGIARIVRYKDYRMDIGGHRFRSSDPGDRKVVDRSDAGAGRTGF